MSESATELEPSTGASLLIRIKLKSVMSYDELSKLTDDVIFLCRIADELDANVLDIKVEVELI